MIAWLPSAALIKTPDRIPKSVVVIRPGFLT